jgi:hypothetical protein
MLMVRGIGYKKTDIQSTPAPYYGPSYGYRGWGGEPYGAYGYGGTEVTTRRYNVGTLVMDVIDREKRQAVFQGGLEDVVTSKMMPRMSGAAHGRSRADHRSTRSAPARSARCRRPATNRA